jgi:hypothetical protein
VDGTIDVASPPCEQSDRGNLRTSSIRKPHRGEASILPLSPPVECSITGPRRYATNSSRCRSGRMSLRAKGHPVQQAFELGRARIMPHRVRYEAIPDRQTSEDRGDRVDPSGPDQGKQALDLDALEQRTISDWLDGRTSLDTLRRATFDREPTTMSDPASCRHAEEQVVACPSPPVGALEGDRCMQCWPPRANGRAVRPPSASHSGRLCAPCSHQSCEAHECTCTEFISDSLPALGRF